MGVGGCLMESVGWEKRRVITLVHILSSVDPDLKSLVYGVGIAEGGEDDWNFVWQKYLQSNDPYEKRLYMRALGRTNQLWLLNRSAGT